MSGDNSTGMKLNRAYQRLLVSILDKSPDYVVDYLFAELQGWALPRKVDLDEIKMQSKNHILVYQGGRCRAIPKESYFAKAIMYGKRKESDD